MDSAPAPLAGIKVLDLTRVLAGPFATQILGDLGAQIIKVEPLDGDEARSWPPLLPSGESGYFRALNRNKRSIVLDLKDERGRRVAAELAAASDLVVENFTPGVVARLGLDWERLRQGHEELIYCSISGFGQDGPYRVKKAYDPVIQGMAGLMSITGDPDGPPAKVGVPITDLAAALHAVIAIEAALVHRLRTGRGQYVDVALFDSTVSLLTTMAAEFFATGRAPGRFGLDHAQRVPARAFEAKDGRYVHVVATSEPMFVTLCRLIGHEEWPTDERFSSNARRLQHREQILCELDAIIRTRDAAEWVELFEAAGLPCGLISDLEEVFRDPQVAARELVLELDETAGRSAALLGFPYRLSDSPPGVRLLPPRLGEHGDEILCSTLGYSSGQVGDLRRAGVLGGLGR